MCLNASYFPIPFQYNVLLVFSLYSRTNFAVKKMTGINKSCPRCSTLHLQEVQGPGKFTYKTIQLIDG